MSTATTFNPKTALIEKLHETAKMYINDLGHIPEDKLASVPMGKARPPLEFTAECAGFNGFVAAALAGTPREVPSEEQRSAYYASIDSLEKATAELNSSVNQLAAAIEAQSQESLFAPTQTPWGNRDNPLQDGRDGHYPHGLP